MKYSHILWDWNGTLLNDVGCAVASVNDILVQNGLPATDFDTYVQTMEYPLDVYYRKLMGDYDYHAVMEQFQQGYAAHFNSVQLSQGARETLEAFQAAGVRQFIVSAFEQTRLLQYVKRFSIAQYFEQISGANDILVGSKSDRARKILGDAAPNDAVFIGDTVSDYQTAQEIGCDCILYSGGHQHRNSLTNLGCPVAETMKQIAALCME